MNVKINIITGELCSFIVEDTTPDYADELSIEHVVNSFKYSETLGIVVLGTHNAETNEYEYKNPIFIPHLEENKFTTVPTEFNGVFDVCYMIIPTKDWFDNHPDLYRKYKTIYYSDGLTIYKYLEGQSNEVPVEELVLINPVDSSLSKYSNKYVSICFLKNCFVSLCQQILDLRTFSECAHGHDVSCELKDKRDLVWMTINVISYLTEFGLFEEVQRIINLIDSCNGICKSFNRKPISNGCGCS